MIIEELKKQNIEAMKAKDTTKRGIYSIVLNKISVAEIENRTTGKTLTDEDVVKIIQKTIKELIEEADGYTKVGNTEAVERITQQKQVLEHYLPKMLTEEEIKNIIVGLEDKSIPSIMRHFKENYGSSADLGLVGKIAKTI